jgi:hypothetical protein
MGEFEYLIVPAFGGIVCDANRLNSIAEDLAPV